MKFTFKYGTDDNGSTGWIPANNPDFFACDGRLLAHDCLEHSPDDSGTVSDECQALGAFLFGRANYQETDGSALGSDMLSLARDAQYNGIQDAPKTKSLPDDEYVIQDAKFYFLKSFENEGIELSKKEALKLANTMAAWIRIGYRKASKRYQSSFDLCNMFDKLQTLVDNIRYTDEGDILEVSIIYSRSSVSIHHKSIYDMYANDY